MGISRGVSSRKVGIGRGGLVVVAAAKRGGLVSTGPFQERLARLRAKALVASGHLPQRGYVGDIASIDNPAP